MQSLSEIRHVWSLHIFKSARPLPKSRANSRTESDVLASLQYLILHFMHGWEKKHSYISPYFVLVDLTKKLTNTEEDHFTASSLC